VQNGNFSVRKNCICTNRFPFTKKRKIGEVYQAAKKKVVSAVNTELLILRFENSGKEKSKPSGCMPAT